MVDHSTSCSSDVLYGVPQGSVLGPLLFSLYVRQLGIIIERHGLRRQLFADDTGLYDSVQPNSDSVSVAVQNMELCCQEIKQWMASNKLMLNDDKSEVLLCGSKSGLSKVSVDSVVVGDCSVAPSKKVRDLGLILDSGLTLQDHISSVVRTCSFHLRTLGKLRPLISQHAANSIAVGLILSRLDYCNSCLWALPQQELRRLQLVQNTAARIVTRTRKSEHISPVLRDLHWLPVVKRVDYKVLCLAFKCFNGLAPGYLSELVPNYAPARSLRSSSQSRMRIPSASDHHQKKHFGFRAFSNAAPSLWNSIPLTLRQCDSLPAFRKQLKTHLFNA